MLGKRVPELNAEENRAKRKNENAQILSSVLPSVSPAIWWQKATGSTIGYSLNGAKWKQPLCHCERGILGLSPHSSVSRPSWESIFPNPETHQFHMEVFPSFEEDNTSFLYSHSED